MQIYGPPLDLLNSWDLQRMDILTCYSYTKASLGNTELDSRKNFHSEMSSKAR